MTKQQSPNYKKLFLKEQRRHKEEQRRREAAELAQNEEQRRRKEEQLRREAQAAVWDVLMALDFALEQQFTLLHTLEESRQAILRKIINIELEEGIRSMTISGVRRQRETCIMAYITKYKPLHKLLLGCIYEGLEDMELDEVVWCRETDTLPFSYIVKLRVEYSYVPNNPRTVYYFLSVPKGDVGGAIGWTADLDGLNRLHLTAVRQMLAFTLQALKTPPRSYYTACLGTTGFFACHLSSSSEGIPLSALRAARSHWTSTPPPATKN
ncbi:hypothetical protein BCR34DRAFT_628220 [Clohesyomyces aquaticus]|uniref:Uncharacterized protein n=1 Tax=Clohesyomyces aquaticus TaxID=1231657 RepID=A0A1Y1YNE4_9PLEO|nr:hypothetical protein BCR34DRAFT_628220 [Clohesyomyces aquaticus]